MKPNDKAIEAALLAAKTVLCNDEITIDSAIFAAVNAAYAAQFQSEEYAGLIGQFRSPSMVFYEYGADDGAILRQAADAIEAVLAERDALKAENDQHKSVYQKYVEAIDRMNGTPCEQLRHHYEVSELRSELALAVSERDALAAIRPHIEAAERERCAKIAEKYENERANYLLDRSARAVATLWREEIAAAIRSGK